jgi:hypothetical protein
MSSAEVVLYLVVVPAAIVAVIWMLASMGGPQSRRRYRPGRRYEFPPVWFVANHRGPSTSRHAAITAGSTGEAGSVQPGDRSREATLGGSRGGASDRW